MRCYENGSHSKIEVSKEKNWTARNVYSRSKGLLEFMESRWEFSFTKEQMNKLIYVTFATDGREVVDELPKEEVNVTVSSNKNIDISSVTTNLGDQHYKVRVSYRGSFFRDIE